jgi:hypothetical protein
MTAVAIIKQLRYRNFVVRAGWRHANHLNNCRFMRRDQLLEVFGRYVFSAFLLII